MYNTLIPAQPTRSAISDASVRMEWEARRYDHSATRKPVRPVQQRPFTHGNKIQHARKTSVIAEQ
jgi:hypothetical protein